MHHQFTIGIEEEYQIIDVESRDLGKILFIFGGEFFEKAAAVDFLDNARIH